MKKISKIVLIRTVCLIFSLILIVCCSWIYLNENTNFLKQANDLIGEREQLMSNNIALLWGLGILFFIIAIIFQLKDTGKLFYFFITEFILIIASFIFILGIFIENFKETFRIMLIFSSFILYYCVYKAREIFDKN